MGCDIHMQVEKHIGGVWTRVEKLPPCPCSWCDARGHHVDRDGVTKRNCYFCDGAGAETRPYRGRSYSVFSVLANVRNDGNVTPICEPRGLPADATRAAGEDEGGNPKSEYEYGDHSFSWLTLDEVLAYDWKQLIDDEVFVDADNFAKWDAAGREGSPGEWSAGVSGGNVVHVGNTEMRRRIRKPHGWEKNDSPYTLVRWQAHLSDYSRSFLAFVESLSNLGDPSDIRLVFGFDS